MIMRLFCSNCAIILYYFRITRLYYSAIFIFLYIFFRRIINAITQMTTENKDPAAVASPIGRSVVEKSADIRYAPGTRINTIARMLCN